MALRERVVPGSSKREYFPLVGSKSALIIVDVQRFLSEPTADEAHQYLYSEALPRAIENINKLADAFRSARDNDGLGSSSRSNVSTTGCEVIFVYLHAATKDGRDISLDYKLSGPRLANIPRSTQSMEELFLPELAPDPMTGKGDILVPKTSCSVFVSTNLDYMLRNLGIEQVVITGQLTDQCVESAVRDAADLGYLVTLVEDACAATSHDNHLKGLHGAKGLARIVPTAQIVMEISAAAADISESPSVGDVSGSREVTYAQVMDYLEERGLDQAVYELEQHVHGTESPQASGGGGTPRERDDVNNFDTPRKRRELSIVEEEYSLASASADHSSTKEEELSPKRDGGLGMFSENGDHSEEDEDALIKPVEGEGKDAAREAQPRESEVSNERGFPQFVAAGAGAAAESTLSSKNRELPESAAGDAEDEEGDEGTKEKPKRGKGLFSRLRSKRNTNDETEQHEERDGSKNEGSVNESSEHSENNNAPSTPGKDSANKNKRGLFGRKKKTEAEEEVSESADDNALLDEEQSEAQSERSGAPSEHSEKDQTTKKKRGFFGRKKKDKKGEQGSENGGTDEGRSDIAESEHTESKDNSSSRANEGDEDDENGAEAAATASPAGSDGKKRGFFGRKKKESSGGDQEGEENTDAILASEASSSPEGDEAEGESEQQQTPEKKPKRGLFSALSRRAKPGKTGKDESAFDESASSQNDVAEEADAGDKSEAEKSEATEYDEYGDALPKRKESAAAEESSKNKEEASADMKEAATPKKKRGFFGRKKKDEPSTGDAADQTSEGADASEKGEGSTTGDQDTTPDADPENATPAAPAEPTEPSTPSERDTSPKRKRNFFGRKKKDTNDKEDASERDDESERSQAADEPAVVTAVAPPAAEPSDDGGGDESGQQQQSNEGPASPTAGQSPKSKRGFFGRKKKEDKEGGEAAEAAGNNDEGAEARSELAPSEAGENDDEMPSPEHGKQKRGLFSMLSRRNKKDQELLNEESEEEMTLGVASKVSADDPTTATAAKGESKQDDDDDEPQPEPSDASWGFSNNAQVPDLEGTDGTPTHDSWADSKDTPTPDSWVNNSDPFGSAPSVDLMVDDEQSLEAKDAFAADVVAAAEAERNLGGKGSEHTKHKKSKKGKSKSSKHKKAEHKHNESGADLSVDPDVLASPKGNSKRNDDSADLSEEAEKLTKKKSRRDLQDSAELGSDHDRSSKKKSKKEPKKSKKKEKSIHEDEEEEVVAV